jgi:hypothetical protein
MDSCSTQPNCAAAEPNTQQQNEERRIRIDSPFSFARLLNP